VALVAALSLSGALALWHLAAVALVGGLAMGLYYPAYSALVPALVPEGDLLAANGLEGVVRPVLQQAAGPAAAGFLVAAFSPGAALAAAAPSLLAAAAAWRRCRATPVRREPADGKAATGLLADVREGFGYMVRTPWLLATLLFASLMLLVFIGPARGAGARSRSRTPAAARRSTPTCWPRSASAGRSARSSSPPSGCPAATSR
jgi:MFS family permease